jgi:hypothetical protein
VQVNESINVGQINWAFKCQDQKKSCEPFASGKVIFNHCEDSSENGIQADGWYQLRFTTGLPETGRFKVDCIAPCG